MLYRLFTENKNYDQIKKLVCKYFDGATIIKAEGIWQNVSEHSLIIEIDSPKVVIESKLVISTAIDSLCYQLKKLNQQDKILVQRIESDSKLV